MSRKEYFAYGSNLNFEQMAYRCPEATEQCRREMPQHRSISATHSVACHHAKEAM